MQAELDAQLRYALGLFFGSINKKKAKPPWNCDFRLNSEHWSQEISDLGL
jgi:hypothetical protein